jgi:hypothetical protein
MSRNFFHRRAGRRTAFLAASGASALLLVLLVSSPAGAVLPGSTFEGNDGNLVVNTTGHTDWANVAGLHTGIDKPSGGSDNSFGQGSKEDDPNATVVTGSIPPNKNDLTRFYEASEQGGNGHIYLYLAWERAVNIGNANMDFEINKNATAGFTSSTTGPITLNRTAGDVLVTYDFGGSGTPTLGLLRWLTSSTVPVVTGFATNTCFSANAFPCWGDRLDLTAAGDAEGAVNAGTISEPLAGGNLTTGLFGEAAIDLTQAGVFGSGCSAFGTTFLKSRSSSSFGAELKDFIAPVDVNINNCGSIVIHKVTQGGDSSFGYTDTGGLSPASFSLSNGGSQNFGGNISAGSYSVTENLTAAQTTAGWSLANLVCTSTGTGTSTTRSGATVNITLGFSGSVDCTYTNHLIAHPTAATAQHLIPNDTFTLSGGASPTGSITFNLYAPSDTTCAGTPALTQTVTVNGNGPYNTTNTIFVASTEGTWRWQSSYSGDTNNTGATSTCGTERFTIANS